MENAEKPAIVPIKESQQSRDDLLKAEKEATRVLDALALPQVQSHHLPENVSLRRVAPSEVAAVRQADCHLPSRDWGSTGLAASGPAPSGTGLATSPPARPAASSSRRQ